jgi:hypothetical protein
MTPGRRRRNSNPLATVNERRWLKTFDRYGKELSSRCIEPMTDLRRLMGEEIARWVATGWTVEGNGAWGEFYANRTGDRVQVLLTPAEHPVEPHSSASFGPQNR